jgi:hypothetical protein
MKIRIIAKPNHDGEILWEDQGKAFTPIEMICPIDGKALELFRKDWDHFLAKLLISSPTKSEFREKLLKKSISLEQIVFGNRSLPWKNPKFKEEIFLQTDPEFTAFPWEILTTSKGFFFEKHDFYRGIRAVGHIRDQVEASNFLLIENPVLEDLKESVNKEGKRIAELFEDHETITMKRLKKDQFKLSRFWDEISYAAYLHYAGHSEKGGIPIPNENILLGEEIGRARLPNLKIVFLNSCHSAYEGQSTTGLASQFLKSGAGFVLGFLTPVETNLSEKIGTNFWKSFLKSKNPRKAYEEVKSSLQLGTVNEFASSLSFVCFSPEEKNRSKNLIFTLVLCTLLLVGLFLTHWMREQTQGISERKDTSQLPNRELVKPKEKKHQNSLYERIDRMQNPRFKNKIYEFLKEENPLLDESEKVKMIEEVLSTNGNEDVKFYHFKQLTGSQ